MKVILKNVRGSYVHLITPTAINEGDDLMFNMAILINKKDPQLKELRQAIKRVAKERWKNPKILKLLRMPIRDGDAESESDDYKDHIWINARSKERPDIVTRQLQDADADDLRQLCFSGAYFNISVNLYAYDKAGNKGVGVGLNNVMLWKKGERLDGRVSAAEDFAGMAADDNPDWEEEDGDDWGD